MNTDLFCINIEAIRIEGVAFQSCRSAGRQDSAATVRLKRLQRDISILKRDQGGDFSERVGKTKMSEEAFFDFHDSGQCRLLQCSSDGDFCGCGSAGSDVRIPGR